MISKKLSGTEALVQAIITQAVSDYRDAQKCITENPEFTDKMVSDIILAAKIRGDAERKKHKEIFGNLDNYRFKKNKAEITAEKVKSSRKTIKEVEDFFRSAYFSSLTSVDGEGFIHILRTKPDAMPVVKD